MTVNFKSIFTQVREEFESTFAKTQQSTQEMGSLNVRVQQVLAGAKAENLQNVTPASFSDLKNRLVLEAKNLAEQSATLNSLVKKVEAAIHITNRSPISSYDKETLNMHQEGLGDKVDGLEKERNGFLMQLMKDFRRLTAEQKLVKSQLGELNTNFKALESHLEGRNWLASLFYNIFSSSPIQSTQESQEDKITDLPALDVRQIHTPYTQKDDGIGSSDEVEDDEDIDADNVSDEEVNLSDENTMLNVLKEEQALNEDKSSTLSVEKQAEPEPKILQDEEDDADETNNQRVEIIKKQQAPTVGTASAPSIETLSDQMLDKIPAADLKRLLEEVADNGEPSAPPADKGQEVQTLRRSSRLQGKTAQVVTPAQGPARKRKAPEVVAPAAKKPRLSRDLKALGVTSTNAPAAHKMQTRSAAKRLRHK